MRQLSEKTLECGKETHVTFIDLEKAFDSVQWSELWKVLRKRDVEEPLIKRIQSFYKCCRNYVRTGNSSSEEFPTTSGVRQGDIMSPYLFIILLDDIIKESKPFMRPVKVGNWRMNPIQVTALAYADDVVLMANSEEGLQHNLNVWNREQLKRGLNINPAKTETMVISKEHVEHSIKLNNTVLNQVKEFKYLGAVLSEDGKPDKDLNTRVAAAGRLYHALNRAFLGKNEISTKTKLAVYNSTYVPTLTYGCESWALTSNRNSRLQAMEMRYLRRVAGKTRRDRVRNQTLRANLKVEALNEVIDRNKMRWFGHVVRMGNHRIPKQVFEARTQGKRPRGRPRMKWIDSIEPAFLKRGVDPNCAKTVATDRKRWRKLCSSSTPQGRRGQE